MSWLDPLLALKTQQAGTTAGTRQTINFASGATVVDDPANDRVNVTIAGGLPGVTVTGTPTAGQTVVASSASAAAWGSVPRGNVANTSGAAGDLITGDATTLDRLAIGSTGQVLTVSGGAPVWAAASPSLLWEADFTTGQTAQTWTAGSTYAVVGSSGTGNINFKHQGATSGGSVAATVTMVNASGLEIAYSDSVISGSSICCALSQLNLGYFSGRPWRLWFYWTYSGTINAGGDNQQMFFDLDGTGATNTNSVPTNNLLWARTFSDLGSTGGTGYAGTASTSFGTNVTTTGAVTQWFTSDVVCASFAPGNAAVSLGTYSAGWPAQASLLAYNGGPLVTATYSVAAPYAHNAGLCFRFASNGAVNFNNRKIIIKAIRIEGL